MSIHKLIVAGGRDYFNDDVIMECLTSLNVKGYFAPVLTLICGKAKGTDNTALDIWKANSMPYVEMAADWKNLEAEPCIIKYNKYGAYNALAGISRNHDMGDIADGLVAFWDGKSTGTKDMIDYMRKLGKPVFVFNYDGELTHEF